MVPDTQAAAEIRTRLVLVEQEIVITARAADRDPASVQLVAVTKTVPVAVIEEAIAAGQRVFGENRVQEAHSKWPALKERYADIELHLIGPLQSNKVREAVALFDVIETVDRPKLARALAEKIPDVGKRPRLFVQVNTGVEPQKAGVLPAETVAFVEEPAMHFALLAKVAARVGIKQLSMGMSGDFARAIQFGATHVRIGTAIFGARASAG